MERKPDSILMLKDKSELMCIINMLYNYVDDLERQIERQYTLLSHYTKDVSVEEIEEVLRGRTKERYLYGK